MSRPTPLAFLPALVVPVLLIVARGSLWPAVIVYHAFCVGAPLAFRCSAQEAGLVRSDPRRWLPLTLMLSVLLLAAGEVGSRWINVGPLLPAGWERLLERAQPWWAFVTYSLVVNAFCEEYLWRGFLLPKTGIAWGGALFWLMHATAAIVFVGLLAAVWVTLPALFAGLTWGWMRQRFGTLWPSLVTHLAADVAILRAASALLQT